MNAGKQLDAKVVCMIVVIWVDESFRSETSRVIESVAVACTVVPKIGTEP